MSTTTDPRTGVAPAPPKPPGKPKTLIDASSDKAQAELTKWKGGRTPVGLTHAQIFLAGGFLFLWLNLFAGGLLVDTSPYRCAISWRAVATINPDKPLSDHPCHGYWTWNAKHERSVFTRPVFADRDGLPVAQPLMTWLLAILFYTPLNLAFISAAAGALGSLGSIANLNSDAEAGAQAGADAAPARDHTNPVVSGLLRGGFVYLFMVSGMLLFDDSPFSMTSPDQYLRLAGFLSLFSFVVNYQPNVFGTLIDWAHTRIHSRNNTGAKPSGEFGGGAHSPGTETTLLNRTVSETAAIVKPAAAPAAEASEPADVEADEPSRNGHSNGNGTGSPAG